MKKILIVAGPTAVGKTAFGIELAQKFNGEIISGDSMQVYREVSIATAKPSLQEQKQATHHLINTQSIYDEFSVKEFVEKADQKISEITSRGKLPIIVGGTGFYLNTLIHDFKLGAEKDENYFNIEENYQNMLEEKGEVYLWQLLSEKDKAAAEKIPKENHRRVIRALTVIKVTGQLFSKQQESLSVKYDALLLGLNTDREVLYQRINQRVDYMMTEGLLDEAKLIYQNQNRIYQAKQAIGYKEFFAYFDNNVTYEKAIEQLKQSSRRYAKRQLTYFRNKLPMHWIDPVTKDSQYNSILKDISNWLKK
ncbi:tRNA (adenosine(37)-N6)-dimethylallyltransferase MiaA [Holzapfeliella floricola]|uniref:tRNA dimethylallyltransferase n=1 Tax=Holzapfeliella floricola DSM 23037 = JCM 16512 TaxID=1423744 RepID=A0A0R2DII8_9LACO|nr:tRNA (adenosine(37)-N6)-dimethylallyltransferase MiaA [Holzapfeliella floricola]KRN03870.1 tRNA delta(2)-isopentenylpyrophosphate [Holzapfeliella floricola DSM 23037 = JCM 16512]